MALKLEQHVTYSTNPINRIPYQVHHKQHMLPLSHNTTKQGATTNNLFSARLGLPTQNLNLKFGRNQAHHPIPTRESLDGQFSQRWPPVTNTCHRLQHSHHGWRERSNNTGVRGLTTHQTIHLLVSIPDAHISLIKFHIWLVNINVMTHWSWAASNS
jgi:hypothetical protein